MGEPNTVKTFLKNLGIAALAGAGGYAAQHAPDALTLIHIPEQFHMLVGTAIGAAIAHWIPKPNAHKNGQ